MKALAYTTASVSPQPSLLFSHLSIAGEILAKHLITNGKAVVAAAQRRQKWRGAGKVDFLDCESLGLPELHHL